MKHFQTILCLMLSFSSFSQTLPIEAFSEYPQTEIANEHVTMKLLLPDPDKGSYRATRFDWSGIIASVKYGDHEYFGYWKNTHDPKVHEDLSGPSESSNLPGPGFDDLHVVIDPYGFAHFFKYRCFHSTLSWELLNLYAIPHLFGTLIIRDLPRQ